MRKLLVFLLLLLPCDVLAQGVVGRSLAVGATPTPPVGSTVRITGLGSSGGDGVIFSDADGDFIKRVLVKADLPAVTVFTDQANTFGAFAQTFGGQVLATDGTLGAPGYGFSAQVGIGMRRSAADTLQLITNSVSRVTLTNATTTVNNAFAAGSSATVGSTLGVTGLSTLTGGFSSGANSSVTGTLGVSLSGSYGTSLSVGTTLGVTGLSTLTGGFNSNAASSVAATLTITAANDLVVGTGGIRAGSGAVLFRNVADSVTTASIGDAAIALNEPTTVNDALTITGLTTAAKITTTGVYGVTNPLTFYATDSTTALIQLYDAGRYVATNSGNDAVWEYHGLGNPSGSRVWRAGNIGGNYLVQSGNDAAAVWTNLLRSTSAAGVPNGIYWGTGVQSVNPDLDFTTNLGAYTTQYANLWIRNLWATTLVAQDVISTIGGAVLVTPTTKVELAVSAAETSFQTTHNEMVAGDIAYINENLATEFVQVSAGPIAGSSTVTYINNAEAVGTSVTIPAHQVGDLIIIFAFANTGNVPALGAQFTNVANCNASGGTTGSRIGYMIADTTAEVSGTWTNATSLMVHIYRSSSGLISAPGACAVSNATASTSLVYPALTLSKTDHSSWVARAAISSAGTNIQNAPTGYTLRANNTAVPETASFDSNGRIQATSVAASAGLTITSANWRAVTLEIVGIGLTPYTYTMTRGYGGTFAARAWPAGVALANTGQTGDGGINMYAIQSIKGSGEQGPTIQGYERTSATFNALSTRWALGNLNGLYNYGAVDVYGLAAGNAADVWFSAEATNGIRFFDAATTVNAHFALDGSILLGQTGAGQANTLITPTALKQRRGTVDYTTLDATGLLLGLTTGTETNTLITSASLKLRRGTTDYVTLDATGLLLGLTTGTEANALITSSGMSLRRGTSAYVDLSATGLQLFDTAATRRVLLDTNGLLLGITTAGNGNILADTSGNLFVRSGTVNRITAAAANGNLDLLDDDGTTVRARINSTEAIFGSTAAGRLSYTYGGALQIYNNAGNLHFQMSALASDGLYLGDWYTGGGTKSHVQITDTQFKMCKTGTGCPLIFDGSTGNITSTGSIVLSTGGNITSTGNFSLTQANGLTLEASSVAGGDAARRVYFGTVGGSIYGYSGVLRLSGGSGAAGYHGAGNISTYMSGVTMVADTLYVGTTSSTGSKIYPNAAGTGSEELGSETYPWSHLRLDAPANANGVNAPDYGFPVWDGANKTLVKYTTGLDMDMTYDYGIYLCTIRIKNGIVTEFLGCV